MFSCSSSRFWIWVEIFTYLDELPWVHCESGSVCRQIKLTSTQKVVNRFWRFMEASKLWSTKLWRENFEFKKKYRLKTKIHKMNFDTKNYLPIFLSTSYFDTSVMFTKLRRKISEFWIILRFIGKKILGQAARESGSCCHVKAFTSIDLYFFH